MITDGYDLVYNWFDMLKKQGHYITGFIIMPNDVHATIAFRKTVKGINTIIGNGKNPGQLIHGHTTDGGISLNCTTVN